MIRSPLALLAGPFIVVLSLLAGTAKAAGDAASIGALQGDREARALVEFQRGREWMAKSLYGEACQAFEESQKLDPGVGTMLNLAYCYEKLGKTASAWGTYREAADAAHAEGRSAWESAARARVARLEGSLLRVLIQVQAHAAGDTLNIWVDGAPLPSSVWGQAAPLYPGQHEVRAQAAESRPWIVTFVVNAEHLATVTVPELQPLRPPEGLAPAVDRTHSSAGVGNARRTAAVILGGVGVASIGVMAAFGLTAISTYERCGGGWCSNADQHHAQASAHNEAAVSTVAGTLGAAALVGAATLWFSGPSRRNGIVVQAALHDGTWGASLTGEW